MIDVRMICKINRREGKSIVIHLNENNAFIKDYYGGKRICNDDKKCFVFLTNVFSLKRTWKTVECNNPKYEVLFESQNVETFTFDYRVPDNWNLFNAFLSELLGEILHE